MIVQSIYGMDNNKANPESGTLNWTAIYVSLNTGSSPVDLANVTLSLEYQGQLASLKYTPGSSASNSALATATNGTNSIFDSLYSSPVSVGAGVVTSKSGTATSSTVQFNETGLPTGTKWTVDITNATTGVSVASASTTSSTVSVTSIANGTYKYTVSSADYSGSSGSFSVAGGPVYVVVTFQPDLKTLVVNSNFAIVVVRDPSNSLTAAHPVLTTGSEVVLMVNTTAVFGGLGQGQSVTGQITPTVGSPGIIQFTTPSAFTETVMELQ